MTLSKDDAALFYELWFPLLDYINQTHQISPKLSRIALDESLDPVEVKEVANYLWEHTEIIDDYLNITDFPEEHREILLGWKNNLTGRFILERHLKKGSVFIHMDTEQLYLVSGIISSWAEVLNYQSPPVLLDATLIPFKNLIISDGLINLLPVVLGGGMKASFKEIYMQAKQEGKLHTTLSDSAEPLPPKPEKKTAKRTVSRNTRKISYVISVSLGKGCYRHLRVSGEDTLDDLAGYILDAFNFEFDHLYSFFMDNQWWSRDEEYVSPYGEEGPFAHCAKLSGFAFQKNQQFKFLFDYGDEWRFQCKVLQVLDEETPKPLIVRSKGEPPEQYPDYDDFYEE